MPLPAETDFQGGDIVLHARMPDAGVNGWSGADDGKAHFIVPFPAFPKSVGIHAEDGLDVETQLRIANSLGGAALEELLPELTTAEGEGGMVYFNRPTPPRLVAGQMLAVQSDGAAGANRSAHLYFTFGRAGPTDLPENLFAISGNIPNGASTHLVNYPVPGDCELVEFHYGVSEITSGISVATLKKNGSLTMATATLAAGAAGRTDLVKAGDVAAAYANRFVGEGDYVEVEVLGVVGTTGAHPYTALFRRL